jgi:hypothetical protein
MDRTTLAGFTELTPALSWFIEFVNIKYKTTQAAGAALAASLFQPVSDKFAPRPVHILLLVVGPGPRLSPSVCPIFTASGHRNLPNIAAAAKWEISPLQIDSISVPNRKSTVV